MSHTFELSGLGKAPFTIIHPKLNAFENDGVFWCEHCGTTIKNRNFVKSYDGKVSVVGIDCLEKTGDAGLIAGAKRIAKELRAAKREAERQAKWKAKQEELQAELSEKHGGRDLREVVAEMVERIDTIKSTFLETYYAGAIITSLRGTDFGFKYDMAECFFNILPWNANQVAVIKEIAAKQVSGSRKESKAYLAAYAACSKDVEELNAAMIAAHDEIRSLTLARDELVRVIGQ